MLRALPAGEGRVVKGDRRLPFKRPASEQDVRPWLTAKGYRALGYEIPLDVAGDDEIVVLVPAGTP